MFRQQEFSWKQRASVASYQDPIPISAPTNDDARNLAEFPAKSVSGLDVIADLYVVRFHRFISVLPHSGHRLYAGICDRSSISSSEHIRSFSSPDHPHLQTMDDCLVDSSSADVSQGDSGIERRSLLVNGPAISFPHCPTDF